MVSEKIFEGSLAIYNIALYKHMTPWGVANLDPRDLIGPYGFRAEDFLSISHYKSMGANDPRGVTSLGPRGLDWQD